MKADERWLRIRTQVRQIAGLMEMCDGLDAMARASGCDPQPVKDLPGGAPTMERIICGLAARARYLLALIVCETHIDPAKCCADAYVVYCDEVSAC